MSTRAAAVLGLAAVAFAVAALGVGRADRSPAAPSPRVVWAVGDGADGRHAGRALARRIAGSDPDRFLYLGDVYPAGTAAEFRKNYATVYGALTTKTAPTPGDNDWPNHRTGYDAYWKRIKGKPLRHYYAFELAGWQLLSLNSEQPRSRGQLRWLRARTARPGTCRIAFWHRPRYSAGYYGDEADIAPLWNALRGHAVLVLNGHDHNMQRLRPRAGITTFVSGAGGRSHYPVHRGERRLAFGNDHDWGALRLTLRPGFVRYAFVTTDARTLDAGTIACRRGHRTAR